MLEAGAKLGGAGCDFCPTGTAANRETVAGYICYDAEGAYVGDSNGMAEGEVAGFGVSENGCSQPPWNPRLKAGVTVVSLEFVAPRQRLSHFQ